ncbi:MAG: hypothetical protein M5R41_00045 [Bacteroidia bacterium]|nr:hypothetical protein [Bacteroidia bacterium]
MFFTHKNLRAWCILLSLALLHACSTYNRVEVQYDPETLISEGSGTLVYRGQEYPIFYPVIRGDTLLFSRVSTRNVDGTTRYYKDNQRMSDTRTYRVHVDSSYGLNTTQQVLHIPQRAIVKAEFDEPRPGAVAANVFLGLLGFLVLVSAIALATKKSCPFVYAYDSTGTRLEGEIYSGAIYPPIERDDYLHLPHLRAVDEQYRVRLTNEVREVQHTNLAELWVIDHPEGVRTFIDKYGQIHASAEPVAPASAVSLEGEDVLGLVRYEDGRPYDSRIQKHGPLVDGVVLRFPCPADAQRAKLLIRAKNCFWLDYTLSAFYEHFGSTYGAWVEQQKTAEAEKLLAWSRDQHIPIAVSVRNDQSWELRDYFNIAGPLAMRHDVLELPVSPTPDGYAEVKLEFGRHFWEVDWVAIDFGNDLVLKKTVVPLHQAHDGDGTPVRSALLTTDDQYHTMESIGDKAELVFDVPEMREDMQRSVFLHSRGHYEILHTPVGVPDVPFVSGFRKPGRFTEFARDLLFRKIHELQSTR